MHNQEDITLITVNWNQKECIELLLKSYVAYHYNGTPLKLTLVDNGSKDGSKEWLRDNCIPFHDFAENIGHENAINAIYDEIRTEYALLVDSDVQFRQNVWPYMDELNWPCVIAGEMIDKNFINETKIKDRISPWFMMFNYRLARFTGISKFRTKDDWTYDVGSEFTEELLKRGFTYHNIERLPGDQDNDMISMKYEKYVHWGKVSWDLADHLDRVTEITKRRSAISEELKHFSEIDLKGKFIYG